MLTDFHFIESVLVAILRVGKPDMMLPKTRPISPSKMQTPLGWEVAMRKPLETNFKVIIAPVDDKYLANIFMSA